MTCAVYLPPAVAEDEASSSSTTVPYLLYLSGLTCNDENVCQKSGIFAKLAEKNIAFVAPDTSPRGAGVPTEDDSWDFGTGAGFYLDATAEPWSKNYRMYSYITKELPEFLASNFPALDNDKVGITGHSMGGHGALTIALKNPTKYKSVSAFAPICNPINCPWGNKAFSGYLSDQKEWKDYDATELLLLLLGATGAGAGAGAGGAGAGAGAGFADILVDVGTADSFLTGKQLLPEALQAAADQVGQPLTLRYQAGYDHSYYFISSFIGEHVDFHATYLQ
eukprot:CAMPEP_0174991702 /NCGR_PEP_ID=MMETSP0004_2-20121128/22067_1 /TAXON_ID=420556 /ORGANISM="Ochromonas sp., Strain CCMP1393" /LENGTH=278 /DNA_ID=CAMNT_0016245537 /DNA_START=126 /DNA_END=962 /DNA_ORIENTATION=-